MTPDIVRVHDERFYRHIRSGSASSARIIATLLRQFVACRSVVDFGCGTGVWLKAFEHSGVDDLLGIDGDHVGASTLEIDPRRFVAWDLRVPVNLGRRFDLAICLEVAEHLPDESGLVLVDSLVRHSDQVLFSAGIPRQSGVGHVSGRWQSGWVREFGDRGYTAVDLVRPRVWHDAEVEYWYAQNAILFVTPPVLERNTALRRAMTETPMPFDVVHPRHYLELKDEITRRTNPGLFQLSRYVRRAVTNALRRPFALFGDGTPS